MGACGDLNTLLMMRFSPSAGGLLSVLRSLTNNTRLLKESLSVSSRSTALSNSSLTTLWGRRASGVTCSWERNRSAWSNLTVSGILLVKKLKRCVSARRWASSRSTRADETAIRPNCVISLFRLFPTTNRFIFRTLGPLQILQISFHVYSEIFIQIYSATMVLMLQNDYGLSMTSRCMNECMNE